MDRIAYKSGYKYQLCETHKTPTCIRPDLLIDTKYMQLETDGFLTIREGYCWDGPSGPAIDTRNFMRGSLVHDVFYQLIREGHLHHCYRNEADKELRRICFEDGMSALRAWWVYLGVRFGGGPAADPAHARKLIYAPK